MLRPDFLVSSKICSKYNLSLFSIIYYSLNFIIKNMNSLIRFRLEKSIVKNLYNIPYLYYALYFFVSKLEAKEKHNY